MVEFWSKVLGKPQRPSREEVVAVMLRESSEAARKRLECAMRKRTEEIDKMVNGVLPERSED